MTGELPHSLLQQLPTWAVFIPTPWIAAGRGVYVIYDMAQVTKGGVAFAGVEDGVDDFVLLFISRGAERAAVVFVRCFERTIGESINAQHPACRERNGHLGSAARTCISKTCSGTPIARSSKRSCRWPVPLLGRARCPRRRYPSSRGPPAPPTNGDPTVLEVGFRLGAALRAHRTHSSGPGEGRHASPLPHVRTAHWHTYWYGPRDATVTLRTAKRRWLAPILVNLHTAPLDVVVRPVHANARRIRPPAGWPTRQTHRLTERHWSPAQPGLNPATTPVSQPTEPVAAMELRTGGHRPERLERRPTTVLEPAYRTRQLAIFGVVSGYPQADVRCSRQAPW